MKRITQNEIGKFIGYSQQMVSDLKTGKRSIGKKKALELSAKTGIPFSRLATSTGKSLYEKIVAAYLQQGDG